MAWIRRSLTRVESVVIGPSERVKISFAHATRPHPPVEAVNPNANSYVCRILRHPVGCRKDYRPTAAGVSSVMTMPTRTISAGSGRTRIGNRAS